MKRVLLQSALSLVLFIFVINFFATKFYWYSAIYWFDKPMHFLGGIFLALATGGFLARRFLGKPFWSVVSIILVSVLIFALCWEFFEYGVQDFLKGIQTTHLTDSVFDLLFGLCGGFIGAIFVYRAGKRYNTSHE